MLLICYKILFSIECSVFYCLVRGGYSSSEYKALNYQVYFQFYLNVLKFCLFSILGGKSVLKVVIPRK